MLYLPPGEAKTTSKKFGIIGHLKVEITNVETIPVWFVFIKINKIGFYFDKRFKF